MPCCSGSKIDLCLDWCSASGWWNVSLFLKKGLLDCQSHTEIMRLVIEHPQQPFPTPPLSSQFLPSVIILPATPVPRHKIQCTRPTQHPPSRPRQTPAIQSRLRCRVELPVIIRAQRLPKATWHVDLWIVESCGAGFEDTNRDIRVLRESGRDDETGCTAANDEVGIFLGEEGDEHWVVVYAAHFC